MKQTPPSIIEINEEKRLAIPPTLSKPLWVSATEDAEVDKFGLYADIIIAGVTQRMRWINPGTFMMGSLKHERISDEELQHQVTLTRGFWLADSACTQELWKTVMGNNPSEFKGESRPVENVSWDDCMKFIQTINDRNPGLYFRLPTEAEWEFACRAGTRTPYSLGKDITPDLVNYDPNYPVGGMKKRKDRKETVKVKSLPPNPWGFYEMHGNVFEWCSDRYGDYFMDDVVDPHGPESSGTYGDCRVMRGGSWKELGCFVRSAYRFWSLPGDCDVDTGFRFARSEE
jgi:formylglycine-generating enzyme required for sulfatase activity